MSNIAHCQCPAFIICSALWQNDEHSLWDEKKDCMLSILQALYLCSSIPFLKRSVFAALALERMRDVPPCWAFGGRKRGLRRKLCLSFSFWSFSKPSARSFALGSSFHFGLGLIWFGFWNTRIANRFEQCFTICIYSTLMY